MNNRNDKQLPTAASFLLTEDCNLRCKYCFEKHHQKVMSIEVLRAGLKYLCLNAVKAGSSSFHSMVFGGEPFLQPDLVEETFRYGYELQQEFGINFSAGIVTNATIYTKRLEKIILEYIDKFTINLQLSVDGVKEVHDMYRVTKAGKGSFDKVAENIPKFKKLFEKKPQYLSIHGCINKDSMPFLYENYKFFKNDWGFEKIWFMPVHEEAWEASDVAMYRTELGKIADDIILKVTETKDLSYINGYAPMDRCLSLNMKPSTPCGAGKTFISITADGDIYPCHHFYFSDPDELKIGTVYDGVDDSKRALFLEYTGKDMSCPSDCECGGCYRCIAVNYQVNGSITSQVRGFYCEMSHIENEMQKKILKVTQDLGLVSPRGKTFIEAWIKDGMYYELFQNSDGSQTITDRPATPSDSPIPAGSSKKEHSCDCGGECSSKGSEESFQILAQGLNYVVDKLKVMEDNQKLILENQDKILALLAK